MGENGHNSEPERQAHLGREAQEGRVHARDRSDTIDAHRDRPVEELARLGRSPGSGLAGDRDLHVEHVRSKPRNGTGSSQYPKRVPTVNPASVLMSKMVRLTACVSSSPRTFRSDDWIHAAPP